MPATSMSIRRRSARLALERLDARDLPSGVTSGIPAWAVGAAPGGEPRVSLYSADAQPVRSFLAYEGTFTGGVRVAAADVNGDGTPDIVTAPGPGGGPRVRVFDGATGAALADFLAYEDEFRGGVWVAAGPVGGGQVGIATGADAGGGPRVRVFASNGTALQDFYAFDPTFAGGVRVALGSATTGSAVYAAPGDGLDPVVHGYDLGTGSQVLDQPAGPAGATGGTLVATAPLDGTGTDQVVTAVADGTDTDIRVFADPDWWVNEFTAGGPVFGLGALRWGDQPALGVLGPDGLTGYTFDDITQEPTVLGQATGFGGVAVAGVAPLPSGPGKQFTVTSDWTTDDGSGGQLTVTTLVTAGTPNDPTTDTWQYHVVNNSTDASSGIGQFTLPSAYADQIIDSGNSLGWDVQVTGTGDDQTVTWTVPDGGPLLTPGGSADFWFTTPPLPVRDVTGTALAAVTGIPATGDALAPDDKCDCKGQTVTKAGWDAWAKAPPDDIRGKNDTNPSWTLADGVLKTPGPPAGTANNLGAEGTFYRTKDKWCEFTFTVEFRFAPEPTRILPGVPPKQRKPSNQDFGNSGVYIFDRYEVQIIDPSRFDSPNDPAGGVPQGGDIKNDPRDTNPDTNQNRLVPGSLYGVDTPNGVYKNWAKPAPQWNTLVVKFCHPVLVPVDPAKPDGPKKVGTPATMTVTLNGQPIWNGDVKNDKGPLSGTGGRGDADKWPPQDSGYIYLQGHWGNQVEFRNPSITGKLE